MQRGSSVVFFLSLIPNIKFHKLLISISFSTFSYCHWSQAATENFRLAYCHCQWEEIWGNKFRLAFSHCLRSYTGDYSKKMYLPPTGPRKIKTGILPLYLDWHTATVSDPQRLLKEFLLPPTGPRNPIYFLIIRLHLQVNITRLIYYYVTAN